jgi:chemotaxis protein CheX
MELGEVPLPVDVRYINPFIDGVQNVYSTMLATKVLIGKPFIKRKDAQGADVSAVIGLSGGASGCVALCFPMKSAIKTASKFAETEVSETDEGFADALGELANMVAGHAKSKLNGLSCSISLPSVIIGREHVVAQSQATPRLTLPCDSSLGRFCVEVGLALNKRPSGG